MRMLPAMLACGMLAGCVAPREVLSFGPTNPTSIVVTADRLAGSVLIGSVSGMSCAKGVLGAIPASNADALEAAKREAAARGATGITRVRYGTTGLLSGCNGNTGIVARATAYRMN